MLDLLDYPYPRLLEEVERRWGKSATYGDALFRELYGNPRGAASFRSGEVFRSFAEPLLSELFEDLPALKACQEEEGTVKFLTDMGEGPACESVLIPMGSYSTLCVSSQLGCRFACAFCATGKLGLIRNLRPAEIAAQVLRARSLPAGERLRNIVFMGMGEPLDNFENLIESIRILSDSRGIDIPKRRISVSTAGHVEGIRRLTALCDRRREESFHTLHLSLSLHSACEQTRLKLMPITRRYPLKELREALDASPYSSLKDGLYIEYLIIPGITDRESEIRALKEFLSGWEAKINLIPYNPVKGSPWKSPSPEEVDRLWKTLVDAGLECRTRQSRGETMMAACGQLGSEKGE